MEWIKSIPPRYLKETFGFYSDDNPNRVGWNSEMDRCWIDKEHKFCVCSRLIRTQFGNVEHVTISSGTYNGITINDEDKHEITWSDKMQIKNELFGENRFAIEVYPKQKNLVDVADVYHLWVFDKKVDMPFGLTQKEYVKSVNRGYSITDEDIKQMKDLYKI